MNQDVDARAAAILAECVAARAVNRALEICTVAWANSRTRQVVAVAGNRARFWPVVAVTAVIVALIGSRLGMPL